ncbi:Hypothetical predicted protein, partial [Xyrichtys novacula]
PVLQSPLVRALDSKWHFPARIGTVPPEEIMASWRLEGPVIDGTVSQNLRLIHQSRLALKQISDSAPQMASDCTDQKLVM